MSWVAGSWAASWRLARHLWQLDPAVLQVLQPHIFACVSPQPVSCVWCLCDPMAQAEDGFTCEVLLLTRSSQSRSRTSHEKAPPLFTRLRFGWVVCLLFSTTNGVCSIDHSRVAALKHSHRKKASLYRYILFIPQGRTIAVHGHV